MIFDKFSNLNRYCNISERLNCAVRFLQKTELSNLPVGRTEILGDELFLNHMIYTTTSKTEGSLFEAHQKYLDLHIILSGYETMAITPIEHLCTREFIASEDSILYSGDIFYSLPLKSGDFVLLYPGEGHLPHLIYKSPCRVEKVVVKIQL